MYKRYKIRMVGFLKFAIDGVPMITFDSYFAARMYRNRLKIEENY